MNHSYFFSINKIQIIFIVFAFFSIFISLSLFSHVIFQESNGQVSNTNNTFAREKIGNIFDPRYSLLVNLTSKIDQIHGHLNASVMNKIDGNESFAVAHAGHPIAEIYPIIELQISKVNRSLSESLYSMLVSLPDLSKNSTNDHYKSEVEATNLILKQIVSDAIPNNFKNDVTFNSFVIVDLLDTAGHEYQEAVTNNTITAMVEYQDSKAFIQEAQKILSSVILTNNHTTKIQHNFDPLFELLDSTIGKASDPKQVYESLDNIFLDLAKAVGMDKFTLLSKLGNAVD